MQPTPIPLGEAERLDALRAYGLEAKVSDRALDDLVALAAKLTGSNFALINVIDAEHAKSHASYGLPCGDIPRQDAMCAHAIATPEEPFIVTDLTKDERFAENPFVTGSPALRSYLGVSLVGAAGHALGTLCVLNQTSRDYDDATVDVLRTLARSVMTTFELRHALEQAHQAATTDTLTGLLNRRATLAALAGAAERQMPIAVIAIDLDYFKSINDSEGHTAGDAVLCAVADRLRQAVRPGDVVGRLGGDEFIVLLFGAGDRVTVASAADRIRAKLHEPVLFAGKELRIGGTLGVAMFPGDADDYQTVVILADQALMRAKRHRRGTIGFAEQEDAVKLSTTARITRDFKASVADNSIRGAAVYLQPVIDLKSTGSVLTSIEALARWTHDEFGLLEPNELFAMIGPESAAQLGSVVREHALQAAVALKEIGATDARIAFNLSASEVLNHGTGSQIVSQVHRAGLSMRQIDIEFREEVLLDRVANEALDRLAALRGRGARLILDDFGAASCGLSQLLRLPLDGLKLDRNMVKRLGSDVRAEEIVRAAISLGHGLGLIVIAKGVETEQQASMLRALGCDAAQGFLFGRPMSVEELTEWLRKRGKSGSGITRLRPRCA